MREITSHRQPGNDEWDLNNKIRIEPADERGETVAGAHCKYNLFVYMNGEWSKKTVLEFQGRPLRDENDTPLPVLGISNEALLAVVLDRLQSFQGGRSPCRENAVAITKLEEVLMWLKQRTQRLAEAGTLGTSKG